MPKRIHSVAIFLTTLFMAWNLSAAELSISNSQPYHVDGVIIEMAPSTNLVTIRHREIPGYMPAMTMPFNVKAPMQFKGLKVGDSVSFILHVTDSESWISDPHKLAQPIVESNQTVSAPMETNVPVGKEILDYHFTNELGNPIAINDFRSQGVAFTFFYTRCPIPEFCPRLSKNFARVSEFLSTNRTAPTNWHLLSISFDPQNDTPEILRRYGRTYAYDSNHWSFVTGPQDKIRALARAAGSTFESDGSTINHNFRTLILDRNGDLQMVFPTSGDLSQQIADELIKAASVPLKSR